jgi:GNAT superfamily N-acetyltransferase
MPIAGVEMTEANQPKIDFGCPTASELVSLYAELAESARYEDLQKLVNAVQQDPNHNFLIEARSKDSNKKLMGYLHAWIGDAGDRGIVYEIAVDPRYHGGKIAQKMLAALLEKTPRIKWRGNSFRISPGLERQLVVVRMMYAVALTFGFQKIVDSTYNQVFRRFSPPSGDHPIQQLLPNTMVAVILLFFALGLLGIRFFWATGNIRRFVLHGVTDLKRPPNTTSLLLFHFPLLILHAVLFFFLCRFYQDICTYGLHDSYVLGLLLVFTFLLVLNVAWLTLLRMKRVDRGPEFLWMANNIAFAVLGIVAYQVFYHCHVEVNTQLVLTGLLILSNSILDFALTGGTYFLGDAFSGG